MAASRLSISPLTEQRFLKSFPRFRSRRRFFPIRARSSDPRDGDVDDSSLLKDDDTRYVLKLGLGSVAGAAVIKYGSILVPQVTRPNLSEALFIIVTPVIAAVLILLTQSRTKNS